MLAKRGKGCHKQKCGPNVWTAPHLFNTLVVCKTRDESTKNEFGEIEPMWDVDWQQMAAVHPVTGREFLRGGQVTGDVTYMLRFNSNVNTRGTTPKAIMEYVRDGVTKRLEVVYVIDLENAGIEVEIGCKEIV